MLWVKFSDVSSSHQDVQEMAESIAYVNMMCSFRSDGCSGVVLCELGSLKWDGYHLLINSFDLCLPPMMI